MDGDSTNREPSAPTPDIRRLPEIELLRIVHVRFREPVPYADGAKRREAEEAIEFQVTTSEELAIRALAPALLVGNIIVTESIRVGERQYVFTAYGKPRFRKNAPISVGWAGSGTPEWKPTKFTYQLEGQETR